MRDLMVEQSRLRGETLAKTKWNDYCGSIGDRWSRATTAILLENQATYQTQLNETTMVRDPGIASMQKFSFPLIRAIFPNLIAQDLVSVQPMTGNASEIFFMSFVYGSNKGATLRGQTIEDNPSSSYSQDRVELEAVGASGSAAYSGSFTYVPIRRNTLVITDGTLTLRDNGAGAMVGDTGVGTNTIDYATGAYSITFSGATTAAVTAEYEFEMEGSTQIPEVDLVLTSSPVVARPRKLRSRWSMEAAFNLRNLHGIDAEAEMVATLAEELKFELDREIIRDLQRAASAGPAVTFNAAHVPSTAGYSLKDHYGDFLSTLVEGSQNIFTATRRAQTNWLVVGSQAASIIEVLDRFVPEPAPAGTLGAQRIGRLAGRWEVYKDPYMAEDEFLIGYKGSSFLETGYVYAPYIPLFMTDTVTLDDFIARKGIGTSYGKKVVNGRFYQPGTITGF